MSDYLAASVIAILTVFLLYAWGILPGGWEDGFNGRGDLDFTSQHQ